MLAGVMETHGKQGHHLAHNGSECLPMLGLLQQGSTVVLRLRMPLQVALVFQRIHNVLACWWCCVMQAVSYWSKAVRASGSSVEQLQNVIEKSVVLGLATNTASTSHSLAELVTTYASTLATQVRAALDWAASRTGVV